MIRNYLCLLQFPREEGVILTNVSNHLCRKRISAMTDGSTPGLTAPLSADSLLAQRRGIEELLARLPADGDFEKEVISL